MMSTSTIEISECNSNNEIIHVNCDYENKKNVESLHNEFHTEVLLNEESKISNNNFEPNIYFLEDNKDLTVDNSSDDESEEDNNNEEKGNIYEKEYESDEEIKHNDEIKETDDVMYGKIFSQNDQIEDSIINEDSDNEVKGCTKEINNCNVASDVNKLSEDDESEEDNNNEEKGNIYEKEYESDEEIKHNDEIKETDDVMYGKMFSQNDQIEDSIINEDSDDEVKGCTKEINNCNVASDVNKLSEFVDEAFHIQFNDEPSSIKDCVQPIDINKEDKNIFSTTDKNINVGKSFDVQVTDGSTCDICSKKVYPMEKLLMDSKCYHKTCFKCCKCGKSLNPSVVSKFNNNIFCKPHYIELFRKRGRYDDINVYSDDDPVIVSNTRVASSNIRIETQNTNASKEYVISSKENSCGNSQGDHNNPVADAIKAWKEGRVLNKTESNRGNSNNSNQINELQSMNSSSKVKNLAAMFESKQ